jgi:hypothetical protein
MWDQLKGSFGNGGATELFEFAQAQEKAILDQAIIQVISLQDKMNNALRALECYVREEWGSS